MLAPHWVLQLANRLGLDLSHALASDLEDTANLFQGVRVAVVQSKPQADDLPLAIRERLEQLLNLLAQQPVGCTFERTVATMVFDKLAEAGVLAIAGSVCRRGYPDSRG